MKKILTGLVAAACVAVLGSTGAATAQQKLTIATAVVSPETAENQALLAFKTYVESRTDNEIEVETFFGSVGGEREIAEQIRQGSLEMCICSDGSLAGFYAPIQIFSIPYVFPSSPVAWAFFDHPFAQELAEDMRQQTGIRVLNWAENGFRNITNNDRPVVTADDMQGLKMRTMESPVYMTFMRSLGAIPTPIAGPEMVLAIRQGIVSGQENATLILYAIGIADVQRYMSVNEHIFGVHGAIINDDYFNALSPAHQDVVREGARVMAYVSATLKAASHAEYLELIREKGVEIHVTTPEEKETFRQASQGPVREYIEAQIGAELVAEFIEAVEDSKRIVYGN